MASLECGARSRFDAVSGRELAFDERVMLFFLTDGAGRAVAGVNLRLGRGVARCLCLLRLLAAEAHSLKVLDI